MNLKQIFKLKARRFEAVLAKPNKELSALGIVHQLIHVDSRYKFVKKGEVIITRRGQKYLLASHHQTPSYNIFNGMSITGTVQLVTTSVSIHPVTGQKGERIKNTAITLDVVEGLMKDTEDNDLRVDRVRYIIGQPVTTDDELNGKRVKDVQQVLGVYIVKVA